MSGEQGDKVTGYDCGCGRFHAFPVYAIAQMTMGNDLTHTCPGCGKVNHLANFEQVAWGPTVPPGD